jgi:hypothetical protein
MTADAAEGVAEDAAAEEDWNKGKAEGVAEDAAAEEDWNKGKAEDVAEDAAEVAKSMRQPVFQAVSKAASDLC